MEKTKISFYFIFISFFTLVTIIFSIVQKSYFGFVKPQEIVENDTLLSDFDPNLDTSIISTIESKDKNIDESFDYSIIKTEQSNSKQSTTEASSAATLTLTPTPTATPTP